MFRSLSRRKVLYCILMFEFVFGLYYLFQMETRPTTIILEDFHGIRDDKTNENFTKIYPNGFWIVNYNVAQYSSYVIANRDKQIRIESLILLSYHNENRLRILKDVRCTYMKRGVNRVYIVNVDRVVDIVSKDDTGTKVLWKIECYLKEVDLANDSLYVAIVDFRDFDIGSRFSNFQPDSGMLPAEYIQFQESDKINQSAPKKQGVAHCVHMVYLNDTNSLDTNITINWLKLQRHIGIDTVRMYAFKINSKIIDHIKSNFDDKFLTFIKYPTEFHDICKWQSENSLKNPVFKLMLDLCTKAIERHFGMKGVAYGQHERINTNDCYLNFRHTHEFVTNYDIDEGKSKINLK
jgi:hypothetical protein